MIIRKKGEGIRYVPPGHDEQVFAQKLFNPGTGCDRADAHVTTFAPGTTMEEEVHPFSDHIFYLLSGSLEVRRGGVLVGVLTPGDAVHIPAGEPHQVSNPGPDAGVFFAVTVPPAA